MDDPRIQSPTRFVVKAAAGRAGETGSPPAGLGRLSPVEEAPGLWLLDLEPGAPPPREAWRAILDGGGVEWAAPVLLDEEGQAHLPTGEVMVRFAKELDDRRLAEFAARNGLQLLRRNEFVPEQASFEPREPRRTYLPDLVESLSAREEVARAWAGTRSRYRRI